METADINMSEHSAADEQNGSVLAALGSASPQESMMGKSVCLDSHWMLLETRRCCHVCRWTLMYKLKSLVPGMQQLISEQIPAGVCGLSKTKCTQNFHTHYCWGMSSSFASCICYNLLRLKNLEEATLFKKSHGKEFICLNEKTHCFSISIFFSFGDFFPLSQHWECVGCNSATYCTQHYHNKNHDF